MLHSLTLRNIALIENLEINFQNGLHVLSGETGAGKSIVVDAVNLVLGGRADREIIRTGTDKAFVEAVFDVPGDRAVTALLDREQIDYDGRTVTICRELSQNGKNICRICGIITSLTFIKEISPLLMDIHGQHEHQFLLNPEMHLQFLDRMGNGTHQQLVQLTQDACTRFLSVHRQYVKLLRQNEKKKSVWKFWKRSCTFCMRPASGKERKNRCQRKSADCATRIPFRNPSGTLMTL